MTGGPANKKMKLQVFFYRIQNNIYCTFQKRSNEKEEGESEDESGEMEDALVTIKEECK